MSKSPPRTPRGAWLDTSCEGRSLCDIVVSHLRAGKNVCDVGIGRRWDPKSLEGVFEKEKEAILTESRQGSQGLRYTMVKPGAQNANRPAKMVG